MEPREARALKGRGGGAKSETDRVTREAEAARVKAQAQTAASAAEADRLRHENETNAAAASAEAARVKLENETRATTAKNESDARLAAASAEADRLKHENETNAAAASAETERLRRDNEAQKLASQAELDRVAAQKAQLETDKSELRIQLLAQFNAILKTTDTARGLIVNMSDVLFDTGKFTLTATGAGEVGQGGWNRLRPSRFEVRRGRLHG